MLAVRVFASHLIQGSFSGNRGFCASKPMLAQDVVQKFAGNSAEKCGKRNAAPGTYFFNGPLGCVHTSRSIPRMDGLCTGQDPQVTEMSTSPPNTPEPQQRSYLLARRTVVLVGICFCLFAVFNHFWLGSTRLRGHYPIHEWPVAEILLTLTAEALLLVLLIAFCEKWYRGMGRSIAQFRLSGLLCFAAILALGLGGWRATKARQERVDREAVKETVQRTIAAGMRDGKSTLSLNGKQLSHQVWKVLEECRNVTELDLSCTNIGDRELPFLRKHEKLAQLLLVESQVTDNGLGQLGPLQNLRRLDLSRTQVSDRGLAHLAKLPNLESLILHNTSVTGSGFEHLVGLPKLKTLSLIGNNVSLIGLDHLTNMPQLRGLDLLSTNITDADLAFLGTLPDLERLFLDNTQVTDTGLQHLEGLANLKRLGLSDTRISDAGLPSLAKMPALELLVLSNTSVTDSGLVHLKGLAKLQSIFLQCPAVTGVGLKHLEALQELEAVALAGPQITDGISESWRLPSNLERLHLQQTSMTEAGIDGLRDAHPDIQITHYP